MSALTSLLARDKIVSVRNIEEAVQRQVVFGGDIETALLELDAAEENVLAAYRAATFHASPATRRELDQPSPEALAAIAPDLATAHGFVPLSLSKGALVIASAGPLDPSVLSNLGEKLGVEVQTRIVNEVRIADALARFYGFTPSPRMARLAERLSHRDAGMVPLVTIGRGDALLDETRQDDLHARRWTFDDDTDEEEGEEADADDGGSADPLQHTVFLQPSTLSAVARTQSSPPGPLVDEEPAPVDTSPRQTGDENNALERIHRVLRSASDRDVILDAFFAFAATRFRLALLLITHENVGEIRGVAGADASSLQALKGQAIPLGQGFFAWVRAEGAARVSTLDQTPEDRTFARSLGRPVNTPAVAIPVSVRKRVVAILYGDHAGGSVPASDVSEIEALTRNVGDALERLILSKKVARALASRNRSSRPPVEPPPSRTDHLAVLGVPGLAPSQPDFETTSKSTTGASAAELRQTSGVSTVPPPHRPRSDTRREGDLLAAPVVEVVRIRNPASIAPPPTADFNQDGNEDARVAGLIRRLCTSGPDDDHVMPMVIAAADAALPILLARFPGPVWFDRRQPHARVPRGRDAGPILRALAALGDLAAPYLFAPLASPDPDVRYYAALLVSELPKAEFIPALRERLFDRDSGVRAIAASTLRHFAGSSEYAEALASLRDVAADPRYDAEKRALAIEASSAVGDPDALATWISVLGEEEGALRHAALEALRSATGQRFGENPAEWASWLDANPVAPFGSSGTTSAVV